MSAVAVVHAAQLVTVAGNGLGIVEDGGMLIRDGRLAAVGRSNTIDTAGTEVIDVQGKVVLPGFVDAHTHLVFGGHRLDDFERRARGESYQQIAKAGGGIWPTVQKTRAASDDELLAVAQKHIQWFVRSGTTTIEAKSGYGLTVEDELRILRIYRLLRSEPQRAWACANIRDSRISAETASKESAGGAVASAVEVVPTFLGAHAVPREFSSAAEYVDVIVNEMLPRVAQEELAEFCDVFCEAGYFDIEQSRQVLTAAKKVGLKLRGHVDQLTNSGGAQLMAELGATTADHLEKTEPDGIAALKRANVQPVLLPGSVYGLGSTSYPRAREMIDAGLEVVLATDFNPGSSPTCSMPMVLSLACTQMKMSPAEAIRAATINAARSLGRSGQIGSLELAKRANFTIWDCQDYREIAYWFGSNQPDAVYIHGERVIGAG